MSLIENLTNLDLSEEVKAKIVEEYKADITGLKNKNSELLGSLKNSKTKLSEFEGIDTEEYKTLKADKAKFEENKLLEEKRYTELLAKKEEDSKKLTETIAILNNEKKSNVLTNELIKAGVKPELVDIAKSYFGSKATLKDDGKVVIGDKELSETISEWSNSEVGKTFIKAVANNGGGTGSSAEGIKGKKFNDLSYSDKAKLLSEIGKEKYQELATKKE